MNAAPGWYDAGTAGRLRWWDGTQWTEHETDAPTPDAATVSAVPMGWYATPAGPIRWWSGSSWTGIRIKGGKPGTDWAATEQPGLAFAFGFIFLALGLAQLALSIAAHGVFISAGSSLFLAALWLAIGATATAVRRIPVPNSSPVAPDAIQPLPGTVEADGAGWYPVSARMSRWWTGARWSNYTATRFGVRPDFQGARVHRTLLIMSWIVSGIGVVLIIAGAVFLVAVPDQSNILITGVGVSGIIVGIVLGALGGSLVGISRFRRRELLLPSTAPVGSAP